MTTNLKFVDVPVRSSDPIQRARENLNARLAEQIALSRDPQLTRQRKKGKCENRVAIQVPVAPWFTLRADGKVILTIKVGGKKVTAVEIPSMDAFAEHVGLLSKAISDGDLDQYLGQVRRPGTKKASAPGKLPVKGKRAA
jgi:hypothetical protein